MQQQAVAVAHHFQPVADETADLIFARVGFPIFFRAVKAEQDFGDGAVALAALVRVERAQRQDMEAPEPCRHLAEIATRRSASEGAPQAVGRMGAQIMEGIDQREYPIDCRRVGIGLWQPELMRDAIDLPDAMPAVRGIAKIETIETRERHDRLGRAFPVLHGQQRHGSRLERRNPE